MYNFVECEVYVMNFILNLLNNWLVQAIVGNIIWLILCETIKYISKKMKSNNKTQVNISNKSCSVDLIQKQFSFAYYCVIFSTFTLACYIANKSQNINLLVILFFVLLLYFGVFGLQHSFYKLFNQFSNNTANRHK